MKRRPLDYGTDIRRIIPSSYVSAESTTHKLIVSFDGAMTFDVLSALSELLGTKNINIRSESNSGGCDTCGDGGQEQWLEISDVTK